MSKWKAKSPTPAVAKAATPVPIKDVPVANAPATNDVSAAVIKFDGSKKDRLRSKDLANAAKEKVSKPVPDAKKIPLSQRNSRDSGKADAALQLPAGSTVATKALSGLNKGVPVSVDASNSLGAATAQSAQEINGVEKNGSSGGAVASATRVGGPLTPVSMPATFKHRQQPGQSVVEKKVEETTAKPAPPTRKTHRAQGSNAQDSDALRRLQKTARELLRNKPDGVCGGRLTWLLSQAEGEAVKTLFSTRKSANGNGEKELQRGWLHKLLQGAKDVKGSKHGSGRDFMYWLKEEEEDAKNSDEEVTSPTASAGGVTAPVNQLFAAASLSGDLAMAQPVGPINGTDFVGDWVDSLDNAVTVRRNMNDANFTAVLAHPTRTATVLPLFAQLVGAGWSVWRCGNAFLQIQLSSSEKLVWATQVGDMSHWHRQPTSRTLEPALPAEDFDPEFLEESEYPASPVDQTNSVISSILNGYRQAPAMPPGTFQQVYDDEEEEDGTIYQ